MKAIIQGFCLTPKRLSGERILTMSCGGKASDGRAPLGRIPGLQRPCTGWSSVDAENINN